MIPQNERNKEVNKPGYGHSSAKIRYRLYKPKNILHSRSSMNLLMPNWCKSPTIHVVSSIVICKYPERLS